MNYSLTLSHWMLKPGNIYREGKSLFIKKTDSDGLIRVYEFDTNTGLSRMKVKSFGKSLPEKHEVRDKHENKWGKWQYWTENGQKVWIQ